MKRYLVTQLYDQNQQPYLHPVIIESDQIGTAIKMIAAEQIGGYYANTTEVLELPPDTAEEQFINAFNFFAAAVHQNAADKGFWAPGQDRNDGEMIALAHSAPRGHPTANHVEDGQHRPR